MENSGKLHRYIQIFVIKADAPNADVLKLRIKEIIQYKNGLIKL